MTDKNRRDSLNGELYSPEERARRDATVWTLVQGILAPLQFIAFALSLVFVINYLSNGTGYGAATASVLVKTFFLFAIMITGAIWEKVVFGRYLFAKAFFWEDVVSMLVMFLHTLYVAVWLFAIVDARTQMWIALIAYASYMVNALQFLLKFKMAKSSPVDNPAMAGFSPEIAK